MGDDRPPAQEVLGDSIGFLLSKLGFLTASRFAAALAPLGIHPGHFGLLRIIEASGPKSQQALGEALGVPASRMVSLIDELEERGLVERRRHADDRRVNLLHLTPKGRRTLAEATDTGSAWQEEMLAGLDDAERDHLLALLQRVAAAQDMPIGVHPGLREVAADDG